MNDGTYLILLIFVMSVTGLLTVITLELLRKFVLGNSKEDEGSEST